MIAGAILSFMVPLIFFCIILVPFGPTVEVFSPQPISVLIMSPILSGLFSPLFIPMMLPEVKLRTLEGDYFSKYRFLYPFCSSAGFFKFGIGRNVVIGFYAALFWIPVGIITMKYLSSDIETTYFILLASPYITLNTITVIPISITSLSL